MNGHDHYTIPHLGDILITDIGPFNRHLRWVRRCETDLYAINGHPFIVPVEWLTPVTDQEER